MSARLRIPRSAWPFALTLVALAATGGTGGTCGGGGATPAIDVCTTVSDCPRIPMPGPGQWACVDGGCQWQKSDVPECESPADCADRLHDACAGAWSCSEHACRWACNEPNPTCTVPADCEGQPHMDCDGEWTCPAGECAWTCIGLPPTCVVSGCSGEICATEVLDTACVWKDWFACLKFTSCGLLADGTCGFDGNDAYTKCLSGATACATGTDCPEGQACIQNECRPACVPTTEVCDGLDNDCNGVVDDGCLPPACTTDADCPTLFSCDHAGYAEAPGCCVPMADGTGCPADYPACPGVCVRIPGACLHDGDCATGQACKGAVPCDCPDGAMCKCAPIVVGTCVAIEPPACAKDSDCANGEACVNGACQVVTPPPACTTDVECIPGQACVAGLCVVVGPACRVVTPGSHGACKMLIGWIFDGKQCVSEGGCGCDPDCDAVFPSKDACLAACNLPVACVRNADCALDQECLDGVCQALPSSCSADADCPAGQYCGNLLCGNGWCSGVCNPNPEGTCVKDADCPTGETCVLQACPGCLTCTCFGTCQGQSTCTAVKPGSHGACEMILGVIFDGTSCTWESGCSCGSDCAAIFPDLATCKMACLSY